MLKEIKTGYKRDKIIFKYGNEDVEYYTSSAELYCLRDGETIPIDFNGRYKVEFRKDDELKAFVSTGRGVDSTGIQLSVERIIVTY